MRANNKLGRFLEKDTLGRVRMLMTTNSDHSFTTLHLFRGAGNRAHGESSSGVIPV